MSAHALGRKKKVTPGSPAKPAGAGTSSSRSLSSVSTRYRRKLQPKSATKDGGFVDTHCHLDLILPRLARERRENARAAGREPPESLEPGFDGLRASLQGPETCLEGCVNIGCSARTLDAAASFLESDGVYGAFGIHPLSADDWCEDVEEKLWEMMGREKVVAWGECGLDYFDKDTRGQVRDAKIRAVQRRVFARQLELAASLGKPLVVHTRKAEEDTLELMAEHLPASHPVHVHCFTSSSGMARELLARFQRLYLGFTGVVTYKSARDVQEVVRQTPLDRLLLETDGPYMAPEPFRGRVAHPGHVTYVAEAIAKIKGASKLEVLQACRENTRQMYGF